MDTDSTKPCELDTVVIVYFGQDADLIDENCDFDNLLNDYFSTATEFNLRMLLANLTEIENQEDGYKVIIDRYRGDFLPDRWDMTPDAWVSNVKSRLVDYMNKKGYSTKLSHF
ncbi:hypothetical protein PMPD1_1517 [Paramixta manurensis]|uniref:CdiI immunity protein domain-containing protein n=1 Tax=Paramixta manurensis TaxID=2740817 RepID=A0A6M8UMB4_9GAMM|nr:hypothetical protein PMPD1_1517 [Erwiniaceae bacterium PD-1]